MTISADISSPDGADPPVTATLDAFGRIDALICDHGCRTSAPFSNNTTER